MRSFMFTIVLGVLAAVGASPAQADPPKGWILAGSEPGSYEVGADKATRYGGSASGYIKSTVDKTSGFGTLMQSFKPGKFAGKRVRLSGMIKADKVSDWAGMWMRVDGSGQEPTAFDNMGNRPIKATKDWSRYVIVLDVDSKATNVAFGVLLGGTGTVWIDDLKFEIVDRSVPTTDNLSGGNAVTEPQNLGFDQ
jgi:hypothetical protein